MSQLTLYATKSPAQALKTLTDGEAIATELQSIGVKFERWQANQILAENASQDEILTAYSDSIAKLSAAGGYTTADVVSLHPHHPDKAMFRQKFLSEHTHAEDEVRFFVKGSGLFCLHANDTIYATLCEQGDLISVPAGITHWFDMGAEPEFTCIRLFTNPEGWVAQFTGSDIAARVPNMDKVIEKV